MGSRITGRRLFVPLVGVVTVGALSLAGSALATAPVVKQDTAITTSGSTITVATAPGVTTHLTATLTAAGAGVVGQTLTFTAEDDDVHPTVLCTAVTKEKGVASCDALVTPKEALTTGLAQIDSLGYYHVDFTGDLAYNAAPQVEGQATFYGTPGLPFAAIS